MIRHNAGHSNANVIKVWPPNYNINLSYIVVKSMKANEANPRVNDNDHKFLLKGITPFSFENPHNPPANMPKNSAQANHLLILGFHSEKESKV